MVRITRSRNTLFRVVTFATITVLLTAATNVILGTAAPDNLIGTPGDDKINGRGGADTMTGLAGNDIYVVEDEADQVVEQAGGGTDTVRVFGWYALPDYVENLTVAGTRPGGGKGNNRANLMIGNSASNDLEGGRGNDTLTGHAGPDDFIFRSPLNANTNIDRVTDFKLNDSILLGGDPFRSIYLIQDCGPLVPQLFHIGAAATAPSHRIIYHSNSGDLYFDPDGSGAASAVRFAALSPKLALTNNNFYFDAGQVCFN